MRAGNRGVRIGVGLTTLQRAGDQRHIEPRRTRFAEGYHGFGVRSHTARHPAVAESRRIEERSQKRLAILRLKDFGAREAPRRGPPVRKRRVSEVTLAAPYGAPSAQAHDRGNRPDPKEEIGRG
jgi:hypothetical protein